jgi:hypothetical protein
MSRSSVAGIATGYGLDDRGIGVQVPVGSRPSMTSIHPPIPWVTGALSPEAKWLEREADRSPPTIAEVKKTWVYTSTTTYAFMA